MRALYVSPMAYGANQAVDAICHGLEAGLDAHGIELRVAYADFDEPDWKAQAGRAVRAGADAGYGAIVGRGGGGGGGRVWWWGARRPGGPRRRRSPTRGPGVCGWSASSGRVTRSRRR